MLDSGFDFCGHRTCTQQWTCSLSVSDTEKHWTWSFTSWKSEKLLTVYHQKSNSRKLLCHVIFVWDYLGHSEVSTPGYCSWLHTQRASGNPRRKRPLVKVCVECCLFKGQALSCDSAHCRDILNPGIIWNTADGFCVPSHSALDLPETLFKERFGEILWKLAVHPICKVWSDNEMYWCSFIILTTEVFRN